MLAGEFSGRFDIPKPDIQTTGIGLMTDEAVMVIGRSTTLVFGLAIVLVGGTVAWWVSRKPWVSGVAAGLLAVGPLLVRNSRWMTPDTFATFFALCSVAMALVALRKGRWWHYALAGLFVGLGAASKYNVAAVAAAIVTAHVLRYGRRFFAERDIYIAGIAAIVGFLAAMPALLFATSEAWEGVQYDLTHYSSGHVGAEGDVLAYYATSLWQNFGLLLLLIPFAWVIKRIRSDMLVLLAFPVVHMLLLLRYVVRFDRNLLPAIPPLTIAVALGLWGAWVLLQERSKRPVALVGLSLVVGIALIAPAASLIQDTQRYSGDHRAEARDWINESIPAGSTIARDWYSPYLDVHKYDIVEQDLLLRDNTILSARPDIVILAESGSGRFIRDPERYPEQIREYARIRSEYCIVAEFGGHEWFEILGPCSQ
jgi:4-amino-4-deoxy-L-arabinose transferase-like glycosyltransferase